MNPTTDSSSLREGPIQRDVRADPRQWQTAGQRACNPAAMAMSGGTCPIPGGGGPAQFQTFQERQTKGHGGEERMDPFLDSRAREVAGHQPEARWAQRDWPGGSGWRPGNVEGGLNSRVRAPIIRHGEEPQPQTARGQNVQMHIPNDPYAGVEVSPAFIETGLQPGVVSTDPTPGSQLSHFGAIPSWDGRAQARYENERESKTGRYNPHTAFAPSPSAPWASVQPTRPGPRAPAGVVITPVNGTR